MKSLWTTSLSSHRLWEFFILIILSYLLFHPPMANPPSMAVALGGGLFLLLFKPIKPTDSFF